MRVFLTQGRMLRSGGDLLADDDPDHAAEKKFERVQQDRAPVLHHRIVRAIDAGTEHERQQNERRRNPVDRELRGRRGGGTTWPPSAPSALVAWVAMSFTLTR
jgi:hypothetical protein